MAINITINLKTDNSAEALRVMKGRALVGLASCGEKAQGHAARSRDHGGHCPVVSGALSLSIKSRVVDTTAYVGTNIEYAPKEELSCSKYGEPHHFLMYSITEHVKEYENILKAALKGGTVDRN